MTTPVDAINDLRRRIVAGDMPTEEECAAALDGLRLERASKLAAAETKAKKSAVPSDLNDLFKPKEPEKKEESK
jgi:hypothetical protein